MSDQVMRRESRLVPLVVSLALLASACGGGVTLGAAASPGTGSENQPSASGEMTPITEETPAALAFTEQSTSDAVDPTTAAEAVSTTTESIATDPRGTEQTSTSVEQSSAESADTPSTETASAEVGTTEPQSTTRRVNNTAVAVPTTTESTQSATSPATQSNESSSVVTPTTATETTQAPTTRPPTTQAPTTQAPSTEAPQPTGPQPVGVSGNWVLDFEDNFDGNSLNLDNWEPVWYDNGGFQQSVNSREDACYHADQVAVSGGNLRLTISPETDPDCQIKDGSQAEFAGAQVTSRTSRSNERYETTNGYFEARMYLPSSNGDLHNWPAFWINGYDWPTQGELDVMEGLSERQPCASFHWQGPGGHEHIKTCPTPAWENPGGWHTFAAHWSEGALTYYYDGVELMTVPAGIVSNEPHFMSLQYTVNTEWSPAELDTLLVDYVRVWKEA